MRENHDLGRLIEKARSYRMTAVEKEEQRRSFAYGNTKIENDRITRELVDRQAEIIRAEERRRG